MWKYGNACRWLSMISVLLATFYAPALDAATPLQKIVFVFAGFNERTGSIFVAKDMRFFEEQGLDVQIVQVRNGQVAVSALAANEAQFYSVSATGASLGAMAGGLDLTFIAGIVNKLDGDFVVAPKIIAPVDLKGGKFWAYRALVAACGPLRCSPSTTGDWRPSGIKFSFELSAIKRFSLRD
jgi:ABC-type nitrate/sulfonate/bicarbonate transport system substrate-binding protein